MTAPRPPIAAEDFFRADVRIGRVVRAEPFPKAKRPAWRLWIDFGPAVGEKRSSARLTKLYSAQDLVGRLIVAVVNFPPRKIADFESEVLVLGVHTDDETVVLLQPERDVPAGLPIS